MGAVPHALGIIDQLAEQRIAEALVRGDFDHLPGAGKPLHLEGDGLVPEDLRAAFRLLRNAGFLPPDLLLLGEIREAEDWLRAIDEPLGRVCAQQRIALLRARLGERRSRPLEHSSYQNRLRKVLR